MHNPAIETIELSKIFNAGKTNEIRAIQDVSLTIQPGKITLIRGPSGSGKTTLLTILGCMTKPTAGSCTIMGNKVSRWSENFLTEFRRRHVGVIFQNFNLISGLTVFENVMLPLIPLRMKNQVIEDKTQSAIEKLHIVQRSQFKINTLSGGEMQRVAIARALVNEPQIILADEPTSHLDTSLSVEILQTFNTLKEEGKTIVIATHDPLVESHVPVDQVICLRDGRLRESDVC